MLNQSVQMGFSLWTLTYRLHWMHCKCCFTGQVTDLSVKVLWTLRRIKRQEPVSEILTRNSVISPPLRHAVKILFTSSGYLTLHVARGNFSEHVIPRCHESKTIFLLSSQWNVADCCDCYLLMSLQTAKDDEISWCVFHTSLRHACINPFHDYLRYHGTKSILSIIDMI